MTSPRVEIARPARCRVLPTLLIGSGLLHLAACVAVPPDQGHSAPDHFSQNPEMPSLDVSRLPLNAALVVPDSVQSTIAEHEVAMCEWGLPYGEIGIPVGELVSSAAEELLSQVFVSVNLVDDHAEAGGNYDVVVEVTSLVVQMQSGCGGGRDVKARLLLGGKITDRWGQTLLGEASFERKQLPLASGYFDTSNVEVIRPALEHALIETMAGLVRRLATKPKLIEYARTFEATHKAPSAAVPVTPTPAITAPPIY